MKFFVVSAMLALFTIEPCMALAPGRAIEARQAPVVTFFFEGPFVQTTATQGIYLNFSQSVPEDGSKVAICKYPNTL